MDLIKWKKKCAALWRDERTWKSRLVLAVCAAFAPCFTFLFFGPAEITAYSQDTLYFGFKEILPWYIAISFGTFAVLTLVLFAFRGKIFNYIISGVFAVTVYGYLQGNFFNSNMGAMTGDTIYWQDQWVSMVLGLVTLVFAVLIPIALQYFNKNLWYHVVQYGALLLVVMQLAALPNVVTTAKHGESGMVNTQEAYLTTDGMFSYSPKQNVFVFLLDRLDYDYIDEVLAEYPQYLDELDGFVSYTNAVPVFFHTCPAASYLMTGNMSGAWEMPRYEYIENAWSGENDGILGMLKNAGFDIGVYSDMTTMFGSTSNPLALKYVSNVSEEEPELNISRILKNMIKLSIYRYAPLAMKPFFWCYSDDINDGVYKNVQAYKIDETRYAYGIDSFSLDQMGGVFRFYHFNGSHPPYKLYANGTKGDYTSVKEQTMGSFQILFNAFAKMKAMGIYKDAGIIITADHGTAVSDEDPLQKPTRIGLFYKAPGSEGTPLQYSDVPVSIENVSATILKAAGVDAPKSGVPLDEAVDTDMPRIVYKDVKGKCIYVYEVLGDASVMENWKLKEIRTTEFPFLY